jgi:ABC-type spermidine/putrescine transport system permease subunit II
MANNLVGGMAWAAAVVMAIGLTVAFSDTRVRKQLWTLVNNLYIPLLLSLSVINLPLNLRAVINNLSDVHKLSVLSSS